MDTMQRSRPWAVLTAALLVLIRSGPAGAFEQEPLSGRPPFLSSPASASLDASRGSRTEDTGASKYFKIQVVDRQTGRGVPLVELRTTNKIRYFTDSNGIVAFYEPGLMDREVFFFVESHGYEFPKDGFGMCGRMLKTSCGTAAVLKIDRINIAERLYRVTGQGIYRDSVLTGHPVPLKDPVLSGQVVGQDSVFTCVYRGRLFWMWGDTNRPSYPLGNFAMSGAVSDLPEKGGLDPSVGVNLEYFVGEDGFSRKMSPLKEPGLVWLDGLITVADNEGRERMVAKYARLKDLGDVKERGLVVFNDATQSFEPRVRSGVEFLPYSDSGHALGVNIEGRKYYYFATPFPVAVRMRVRAEWDDVIDPNCYEVLTALEASNPSGGQSPRLDPVRRLRIPNKKEKGTASNGVDIGESEKPCRWVPFGELAGDDESSKTAAIEKLKQEKDRTRVHDIESGKKIFPHNGSVYFNAYRQRWVAIFVQQFGESSFLGEVWYAEADSPVGPWAYARKIVTHNKYSFYNPKQHPHFDQDGGRVIFFEGTYTFTFSGSAENATPRYDYNQIMYRLNLDDPRLALPVAVYQIRNEQGARDYLLGGAVVNWPNLDMVESVPFYAIEPDRANGEMVAVYAQKVPARKGLTTSLTLKRPDPSADPLFYSLPASDSANENPCVLLLYEYRHADTRQYLYSTRPQLQEAGWVRTENPLCRVWRTQPETIRLDGKARPAVGY